MRGTPTMLLAVSTMAPPAVASTPRPSVHVVELPARFNTALLHLAEERWGWGVLQHGPYGAPLPPPLPTGWYNTSGAHRTLIAAPRAAAQLLCS